MTNLPDRPLTDADGEQLLLVLLDAGVSAPPSLDMAGGLKRGARNLRLTFTAAGLTHRTAWEGVLAYLAEPQASQYPRAWPTAGHIAARTREARAIAEAPDDAVETYQRMLVVRMGHGATAPENLVIDRTTEAGARRERAMWAGVQGLGGWTAIGDISRESVPFREKDFTTPYRAIMRAVPGAALAIEEDSVTREIEETPDQAAALRALTAKIGGGKK